MQQTFSGARWSLGLYFGWLLSLPLHGPVLGALSASHSADINALTSVFTLSHAMGLLATGLLADEKDSPRLIRYGVLGSLVLSCTLPLVGPQLWGVWMGVLGPVSALFVIGWTHAYVTGVVANRTSFMAEVIFIANAVLYVLSITARFAFRPAFLLSVGMLAAAALPLRTHSVRPPTTPPADQRAFPTALIGVICLLVSALYLGGGFLYSVIAPSFARFAQFDAFYGLLPYLAALVVIRWLRVESSVLVYVGPPVLGLGFLAFAWFGVSLPGYFIAQTLILAALAAVDVFLWALLGEIGGAYCHPQRVFGLGLASNVLALFAGGLLGERFSQGAAAGAVPIGLMAATAVFSALLLVPLLRLRVEQDLLADLRRIQPTPTDSEAPTTASLLAWAEGLTDREREVTALIIEGCSNAAIASRLFISENTVKVHLKNVYRKLGVCSKQELLSIVIRSFNSPGFREAAPGS